MSAILSMNGVHLAFDGRPVLRNLHLELHEGELVVVVGRSGCGKSTLLRIAAGLLTPDRGQVTFRGRPVLGPPRGIQVVFQQYTESLFPWLTVAGNIRLALLNEGLTRRQQQERIDSVLELVQLRDHADALPGSLSGGMAQRAAIARSLAVRPALLCMDAPFGALDATTRHNLQDVLLALPSRPAVLFVSHDVDEALYLSDRVVLLHREGPPTQLEPHLPRPRDQVTTPSLPSYHDNRARLMRLLEGEP